MKQFTKQRLLPHLLCILTFISPVQSWAEDIDIFLGSSAGTNTNPKVLIIVENTSNWSRAAQKWPGGLTQGESEVRAIKTLIGGGGLNVDMGLMEYATAGSGNAGGFIRKAITPLDAANTAAFSSSLTTIFNNINDPNEKVNSAFPYGDLMYSAYNYFSGGSAIAPSSSVVASKADSGGYTSNYGTFKSPLADTNACGRNFVVYIGNNAQGALAADTATNGSALVGLGGSISPQLPYQNYITTTSTSATDLGYTSLCYASQAACSTTDYATTCATGGIYNSCTCSGTTTTALSACAAGSQYYSVYGNTTTPGTTTTTTTGPTAQPVINNTGRVSQCYATSTAASSAVVAQTDIGGFTCPAGGTSTSGSTTTTTTNSCSYVLTSTTANATACTPTTTTSTVTNPATTGATTTTTSTATTTACYTGISSGGTKWSSTTDYAGLTCPATTVVPATGFPQTTTTYTCTYTGALGSATGCGSNNHVNVTRTATGTPKTVTQTTTTTTTPNYSFNITQKVTPSVTTTTTTTSASTTAQTFVGNSTSCYATGAAAAASSQFTTQCSTYNSGCTGTATVAAGQCSSGARYLVKGNILSTVVTPDGTSYTPTDGVYADEWARFMHQDRAKNAASTTDTIKQSITTYTIDVYNAQQNGAYTAMLQSMAAAGGGKYYAANNEQAILDALNKILAEIQSVNSTFASASLPVNATNRTQNANQVFIGMFRPDPGANPRWFGNLKQYAVGRVNGVLDLVDKDNQQATNALTGFVDDCAASFWTTDSGNYWGSLTTAINPDPRSKCPTALAGNLYSDLRDGPTVEKGAVAEVLRKGNDPSATTATYTFNRTMLTSGTSGTTMSTFDATSSGLSATTANNLVGFTQGKDVNNDTGSGGPTTSRTRPSIHGDVVHSRPLPINYGTAGVTVYYGANDGSFRAVDASTVGSQGKERWSYIAPEFYAKLQRLKDNAPLVSYPSVIGTPKDYFFDGSTGIYQNADNSKVWIYPTQRRGGRMIYGFNVSTPGSNPVLKWRHGCPNLTDDTGCTTGGSSYSDIGQTWSTPNVAFVRGFSTTIPIMVVGGGYDACEDADSQTKSCGSGKGKIIYVINADTGDIIRSFTTLSSVAADVSFIDLNNDSYVDYAYVGDTGGNIYRIDFVNGPSTLVALASSAWVMRKVAYTNGGGRKFLFTPGLFASGTSTYVALTSGDRERPLITNYPYTTTVVNRAYVYRDDLTLATGAVDMDGSTMLDFTSATGSTCTSDSLLTPANLTGVAKKNGWFMSLTANGRGEQGVTSSVIVAGMVTFSTNRPIAAAQSCGSILGEARGYFVNLFNASGSIATANNASCGGERSSIFTGGGLPPSPVIGIVPIDGQPTAVLIGAVKRDGNNSSPISPSPIVPPITQVRTRTYKSINSDK